MEGLGSTKTTQKMLCCEHLLLLTMNLSPTTLRAMDTVSSSTTDSTPDIVERLQTAIQPKVTLTFEERFERIERLHQLAVSLEERGLLVREKYKAATKEDFRRIYGDVAF